MVRGSGRRGYAGRLGASFLLAACLAAITTGVGTSAMRGNPPAGQYFFDHGTGENTLTGGFILHGAASITAVGITTDLIACTHPPAKKVQFPSAPDNWQPQKTIPVHRSGANLKFAYSGSFSDRLNGYPEGMVLHGTITPAGVVTGSVSLTEDDNTASTGEVKCTTRGSIPFTGKHG